MKSGTFLHHTQLLGLLVIPLWYLSLGCDSYNFTSPQPTDKKNLSKIPGSLQGRWIDDTNFDQDAPFYTSDVKEEMSLREENTRSAYADDSVLYVARDQVIEYITVTQTRIMKGAWPKLTADGKLLHAPPGFSVMEWIDYDSLQKEIKRTKNYTVQGNRIYEISRNNRLETAADFSEKGDTLFVTHRDTIFLQLGPNVCLRQFAKDNYALSIRNRQLAEDNGWWSIYVLEQKGKDLVYLYRPDTAFRNAPGYLFGWEDDRASFYYFDASWQALDMHFFMANGYFKRVARLYRNNRPD